MEFKYRAIDKKPQPPPPPPHATTFFSSGQPLGGESGFARMVPPTMSAREALQRELEKERIRREIIAEEMARARRWELEEEVRREMALERELGFPMQRGSLGPPQRFLFHERVNLLNSVAAIDDMPPKPRILEFAEMEPANNQDSLQERANMWLNPKPNNVAIENMPQPRIMDPAEVKPTNKQDEVIILAKPNPDVYEAKRKTAPAVNDYQFGVMKKPKKEWRCPLCGVSATDESGLNAHLHGKKHKAKKAALEVEKIGLDVKADIKTHQSLGEGDMTQHKVDSSAVEANKEEQVVQKSQNIDVSEIKETTAEEPGKTNALVKRNMKFWCDICGIGTLSQVVMGNHIRGKKHRRQMELIASQNNGSAPPTCSADNFSCSGKVHSVAASREDRERVNLQLNPKLLQVAIEDIMDPAEIKPNNNQDQLQGQVNLCLNPKSNQVAIEDLPQPRIVDPAEIKPSNQDEDIPLAKPDTELYDAKRKAEAPALNDF